MKFCHMFCRGVRGEVYGGCSFFLNLPRLFTRPLPYYSYPTSEWLLIYYYKKIKFELRILGVE